jgi:plasmid stabilization system protein ParE
MLKVYFTDSAKRDIRKALKESGKLHGLRAKSRYKLLLDQAILKLRESPQSIGVQPWDDTRCCYHLRHSKHRATIDGIPVKKPVHTIFFKVDGKALKILRILHERMDFDRHF